MSRVSTYLNFQGNTAEAFEFYRAAFGTEYVGTLMRMGDMPGHVDHLGEAERQMIMHIELPILGGHVLMGTDFIESMGHILQPGNNVSLNLEPDTLEEAQRLHAALSEGADDVTPLQQMPWGAWWSSFIDRFGTRWMFNVPVSPDQS